MTSRCVRAVARSGSCWPGLTVKAMFELRRTYERQSTQSNLKWLADLMMIMLFPALNKPPQTMKLTRAKTVSRIIHEFWRVQERISGMCGSSLKWVTHGWRPPGVGGLIWPPRSRDSQWINGNRRSTTHRHLLFNVSEHHSTRMGDGRVMLAIGYASLTATVVSSRLLSSKVHSCYIIVIASHT